MGEIAFVVPPGRPLIYRVVAISAEDTDTGPEASYSMPSKVCKARFAPGGPRVAHFLPRPPGGYNPRIW